MYWKTNHFLLSIVIVLPSKHNLKDWTAQHHRTEPRPPNWSLTPSFGSLLSGPSHQNRACCRTTLSLFRRQLTRRPSNASPAWWRLQSNGPVLLRPAETPQAGRVPPRFEPIPTSTGLEATLELFLLSPAGRRQDFWQAVLGLNSTSFYGIWALLGHHQPSWIPGR
ncbi:hypothetical protein TYRP_022189 [Tyrophagus putrescentiae]|nr:hypothetical protein TYRP_022189 [Tyrophagus putrescentiae]